MNKCLFIKLEAVVDNDNLTYFDAIKLNCAPCTNGQIHFTVAQDKVVIKVLSGIVTSGGNSFTEKTFYGSGTKAIVLDPEGCVILIKNVKNIRLLSTPATTITNSWVDGLDTSNFNSFYNLNSISIANPKGFTGTIMDFVGRNMSRLQFNGINCKVNGEIKEFVRAECLSGRIDGSTTLQFYPKVTFDGKAGSGTSGDVKGTVTYNESGAVVVLTGGTAVAGTYNYDKSTDAWTTGSV